ncbi:LysM peptidoglycan-binding domain-containing protein [Pseudoalteromonas fenneropenaei]|uniref:LysM peptidoglycan-binding domain-containing protein n=1 Tax=Pseudoalteromonas fenneropenaei TaxID=1737459 RepID=A0ABV7CLQ6_9GAMM
MLPASLQASSANQQLSTTDDVTPNTALNEASLNTSSPEVIAAALVMPPSTSKVASAPPKAKPKVSYDDLWQELQAGLRLNVADHPRLQKRIAWYRKQPQYLVVANKRAAPFLYHIVQKVKQQGLPMELALLPFVESDFRLNARSSEQAIGVWQLMSSTAHHFGIKQNPWYDGRLDVLAATDAALAYLKYLHQKFDGDWLHALAAYNSGEGRVMEAIANNRKLKKSTHFWHLKLPKETAEYVPKLLALSSLLRHPNAGITIPSLPNRATTTPLDIAQPFDFAVFAKLSGLDKQRLHALNPAYLRHRSAPQGPHTLLLPYTATTLVQQAFYRDYFSLQYQVKPGDTLYSIAKRSKISVAQLKSLNSKQQDMIRVGETLLISQPNKHHNLLQQFEISPYVAQTQQKKPELDDHQHVVTNGESLWSISRHYGVAMRDLSDWNHLGKRTKLKLGQKLLVKLPKAAVVQDDFIDPLDNLKLRLKQNSQPL